eukprot:2237336-Rhodomonas_salina.5
MDLNHEARADSRFSVSRSPRRAGACAIVMVPVPVPSLSPSGRSLMRCSGSKSKSGRAFLA